MVWKYMHTRNLLLMSGLMAISLIQGWDHPFPASIRQRGTYKQHLGSSFCRIGYDIVNAQDTLILESATLILCSKCCMSAGMMRWQAQPDTVEHFYL